jgi:hypothetical protein
MRVVMDPALFLEAVADPARRAPLEGWRDRRYRLLLTRRMLAHLLGLLKVQSLTSININQTIINIIKQLNTLCSKQ